MQDNRKPSFYGVFANWQLKYVQLSYGFLMGQVPTADIRIPNILLAQLVEMNGYL
jgi:hypothetical protein